jgi:hypothetical protein
MHSSRQPDWPEAALKPSTGSIRIGLLPQNVDHRVIGPTIEDAICSEGSRL